MTPNAKTNLEICHIFKKQNTPENWNLSKHVHWVEGKKINGDYSVEKLTLTTLFIKVLWMLSKSYWKEKSILNALAIKQERIKISEAFNPSKKGQF